jgi:uncharacterized SAM-binding protein YcdF (DUF218 family)
MFFPLSKIIDFLLLPICWIIVPLLYALFQKNQKKTRIGIGLSFFILLLSTNGFLVNNLYQFWELKQPQNLKNNKFTWGIVLGGGIVKNTGEINNKVVFAESSDRLLQTLLLYKKGIIKKILITGGNTGIKYISQDFAQESKKSKEFLVLMGVKDKDIFVEDQAKNTYENAKNSRNKLLKYIKTDSMLVITSAYHSRRSRACFEKQGFKFKIFPVDQIAKTGNIGFLHQIIPEEKNLYHCSRILREMAGLLIYRIMGYC